MFGSTMNPIANNLNALRIHIPERVKIIAVSKTHTAEEIMQAYRAGQRQFGENRVQEICAKQPLLPSDIEWHFVGHLQTNKVKYIAPFISIIHSVDSSRLLKEINREAAKNTRIIKCLLQFHIAAEETKYGFDLDEALACISSDECTRMNNVEIIGVMGMATFTDDMDQVRREFRNLRHYFDRLKADRFSGMDSFNEISMGMSGDYPVAIAEGSTMVRIGTAVFGERNF